MIYIHKIAEPPELVAWKAINPDWRYKYLDKMTKIALQLALLEEQGYVCCFCGIYIGCVDDETGVVAEAVVGARPHYQGARVAHIVPQSRDHGSELDYENLGISCPSQEKKPNSKYYHCDKAQMAHEIFISPRMENCISFFVFDNEGNIDVNMNNSVDERKMAEDTIKVLNLNVGRLKARRSEAIRAAFDLVGDLGFEESVARFKAKRDGKYMEFHFVILSHFAIDGYY